MWEVLTRRELEPLVDALRSEGKALVGDASH
jgi:hypothetical protein